MGQLGWPKIPVLMVGNDIESDIKPARQLGIEVFWTTGEETEAWKNGGEVPAHGQIEDFIAWLETIELQPMPTSFKSIPALMAVLRSTPAALATLCRQKPARLDERPAPKEWSACEVLCHLRDVDTDVNLWRLRKVLNEVNPFLPGQDTDQWADTRQYCLQDGLEALADFTKARVRLLNLLTNLAEDEWDRPARHAIFGPTSLCELVNIIAGHDIVHVQQVFRAL
jgi:FMN phosphatase YigB (HAD superfamily)